MTLSIRYLKSTDELFQLVRKLARVLRVLVLLAWSLVLAWQFWGFLFKAHQLSSFGFQSNLLGSGRPLMKHLSQLLSPKTLCLAMEQEIPLRNKGFALSMQSSKAICIKEYVGCRGSSAIEASIIDARQYSTEFHRSPIEASRGPSAMVARVGYRL